MCPFQCYLVFDRTTHLTVGVVEADSMELVLPPDPVSWILTSEAAALGHLLETVPYRGSYEAALRRFRRHEPDQADMAFEHPAVDVAKEEKKYKKQGRRSRTDRIPDKIRIKIVALRNKGKSLRKLSKQFDVSLSTIQRILEEEKANVGYRKTAISEQKGRGL